MPNRRQAKMDIPVGELAFGSVTNSYTPLKSNVTARCVILIITNTLNQDVYLTFNDTGINGLRLPAGQGLIFDFGANGVEWSGTVYIKYVSVAPTAGNISAAFIRSET